MSELALIKKISKQAELYHSQIARGIGDDAALIDRGGFFEVITTDMLVEDDHFNLAWSSPEQISRKSLEVNVSDIAAMGGTPQYALVSLALPKERRPLINGKAGFYSHRFTDRFYRGFNAVCRKYKISLIGGDTTHGEKVVVNVVLIGRVDKKNACLRSDAKAGDIICVTGNLGGSTAGLELLREHGVKILKDKRFNSVLKKHLEPAAQLEKAKILAPHVNAMIDVSDGLASEVRHICEESQMGAEVYAEQIPISAQVELAGEYLKKDPQKWALSGGEDFELVFTAAPHKLSALRGKVQFYEVGRIVEQSVGVWLVCERERQRMPRGYDHFC